jgi:hypothetical protein
MKCKELLSNLVRIAPINKDAEVAIVDAVLKRKHTGGIEEYRNASHGERFIKPDGRVRVTTHRKRIVTAGKRIFSAN